MFYGFLFLLLTQEDQNRGKPNWEHLSDDLHVLLTVEDTENRAQVKLARAVEEVKKLLVPVSNFILNYLFILYFNDLFVCKNIDNDLCRYIHPGFYVLCVNHCVLVRYMFIF